MQDDSSSLSCCEHQSTPTTSEAEEEETIATLQTPSTCQRMIERNENSKKMLHAMAVGLKDASGQLLLIPSIKFPDEPYASSRARKSFVPACKDLQKEVIRRARLFEKDEPKCKNWKLERLEQFLVELPLTDRDDVEYLRTEVLSFKEALQTASSERNYISQSKPWNNNAFLRLAHVLLEDDVKLAFIHRHDCMDQHALDARNHNDRPPTFEEACAEKFNDTSFIPSTVEAPTLHSDYAESFELLFDEELGPVTPEQVKTRMADTKTKLMIMIDNWERSGNGDGNNKEGTEENCNEDEGPIVRNDGWGHFPLLRMTYQDDNRENFLPPGHKSYLLYWWHLMDAEDILLFVLNVLPGVTSATCDSIPRAGAAVKRRKRQETEEQEEERVLKRSVTKSFSLLSLAAHQLNLSNAESTLLDLQIKRATADNDNIVVYLDDAIARKKEQITTISSIIANYK
jgi:hypothetical protein